MVILARVDESNFIDQLKRRNSKAMDYVLDEYGNLIYRVVYGVLGQGLDKNCIEECMNDILLNVWKNIDCFSQEKGSFKTWLMSVSKYKAIDYKRTLVKEPEFNDIDDYTLAGPENLEDDFIKKENKYELLEALNFLKERDRDIFFQRYFMDEDINDIARKLGVSRAAVDNVLSRGRKILREKLKDLFQEVV